MAYSHRDTDMPGARPPVEQCALIVVDMQVDFMPGGALPCARGHEIVEGIQAAMRSGEYGHIVATQDWHPAGHISFASSHGNHQPFDTIELYGEEQTLWPDHCVRATAGAVLDTRLDWSLADVIIRKGSDPRVDSYSAFRDNPGPRGTRPSTGLAGWLQERGVTEVSVCGLAREVCVLWTAEDAHSAGFNTRFLWPLSRPVSFDSDTATYRRLEHSGIAIVDTTSMDPPDA
ncbi:nicotinamidase [Kushneria sp. TE3]|uniref:nicotinamidase n=1 Tax=Kushneria sp. TE3 TaxID=3449832 RepID=UPI003F68734C